ncbi:MAG: peptidoglycan editing factor PgeF [Candidatus Omnitrophica bacterium]|nr:peptidoglycan editing factor PgeF [Candidatus Omnitrophota bacterium]
MTEPSFALSDKAGWLKHWASSKIVAGTSTRSFTAEQFLQTLAKKFLPVEAEQVHGASIAILADASLHGPIAGCDALITRTPGIALLARSADCLPIFFADPRRGVVAIAHAGWRGLALQLPARLLGIFRQLCQANVQDIHVAIGPGIRACCYAVGKEFLDTFGSFVRRKEGQLTCDLTAIALSQLRECGVLESHIFDCGQCSCCEVKLWWSLRRDGQSAGRMTSVIALSP